MSTVVERIGKVFRPELSHITEESSCKSPAKANTLDHSVFQPDKRALSTYYFFI